MTKDGYKNRLRAAISEHRSQTEASRVFREHKDEMMSFYHEELQDDDIVFIAGALMGILCRKDREITLKRKQNKAEEPNPFE